MKQALFSISLAAICLESILTKVGNADGVVLPEQGKCSPRNLMTSNNNRDTAIRKASKRFGE